MKLSEPSKLNESFGVRRVDCAGQGYRMSVTQLLQTGFLLEQGQLVIANQTEKILKSY